MPTQSQTWFEEAYEIDLGRTFKIRINRTVERFASPFQTIEILETAPFGKMLVLDGVVMCTEWDESSYHEMIAHVPLSTHAAPRDVLIIGGGDGGTAREVLKHDSVRRIDLCEIDPDVVRLCRKHLPTLASSFDDPRVTVYAEDGAAFVAARPNEYDVIIVDSSDPIGPAEVLFSKQFYTALRSGLREDGIAVTQSESIFYHEDTVAQLVSYARSLFPVWGYYTTMVPTYPSGTIGFTLCSKGRNPVTGFDRERTAAFADTLSYYTPKMHTASFSLPARVERRLS